MFVFIENMITGCHKSILVVLAIFSSDINGKCIIGDLNKQAINWIEILQAEITNVFKGN